VRSFEGEKPGKFATLLIADHDGVLRVVLWNEKADLIENKPLKNGQAVRLLHGYTRADKSGKVELHLGGKSKIEIEPAENADLYPAVAKFAVKIADITLASGTVHVAGTVKEIYRKTSFSRIDSTEGFVMRFTIADDSGEVTAVTWDEKVAELEKSLKAGSRVNLLNARVKESRNGKPEVHIDSNTFIEIWE